MKGRARQQAWLSTIIACALLLLPSACASRRAGDSVSSVELNVAAASDLQPAFEELGKRFEQETGIKTTFSFGSTGNLARQIEQGLPVDLFAAANVAFIEQLEQQGLLLADTRAMYARGRITIWARADSPLRVEQLEDLTRPEIRHIAIANPEHAPYGLAAKEALEAANLWEAIRPKLVYGETVRQATQFAETGNAEVALTALSLSIQSSGRWTLIPDHLYKPLHQALAVIKSTRHEKEARRFAAYINSPPGQLIMEKYGFTK